MADLTPEEDEYMQWRAAGMTNSEIASYTGEDINVLRARSLAARRKLTGDKKGISIERALRKWLAKKGIWTS
jgi:DNA-binding CsgD family transcriptional regulator